MKIIRKLIISLLALLMLLTKLNVCISVSAEETETQEEETCEEVICMAGEGASSENDEYARQLAEEIQAATATASLKVSFSQDEARSIHGMVNAFRTGNETWVWNSSDTGKIWYSNLGTLYYDYELEKCALQRAAEIALKFAHTRPDGSNYSTVYPSSFGNHSYGENIAMGYRTAEIVFDRWKEDDYSYSGQGHRRNMLNPRVSSIGIACVIIDGYKYWVQEFSSARVGTTPISYGTETRSVNVTINQADGSLSASFKDSAIEKKPEVSLEVGYPINLPQITAEFSYRGSAISAYITTVPTSSDTRKVTIENNKIVGISPGDTQITYRISCGSYTVTKKLKVHCKGHVHEYYFTWDWADDYSSATGTYVCATDKSHTGTVQAEVTSETTEPSCWQDGAIIYTARAVVDGQEYTGEKIITIPATGDHDYGEPVYTWEEGYGSVTASVHCDHGGEDLTETAVPYYEVISEPTADQTGLGRLSAEFENEVFETQYIEIEIPKLSGKTPASIAFDPDTFYVPYGGSQQLSPSFDPANADAGRIIWTTDDPEVATVDENGRVTAHTPGIATITAYTLNGLSAECYILVMFRDVADSSKYYFSPVYFCAYYGITVGHGGPGKFSPDASCTREQIVTFLWRLYGSPEPETESNFSDVRQSAWYYKPVTWAYEKGITTGLNDGTGRFGVGQPCTREQCVTFLYRAAGSPNPHGAYSFKDVKSDKYYYNAVMWAWRYGITVGLNDGTGRFGVGYTCTRAMIVTFLYRFVYSY